MKWLHGQEKKHRRERVPLPHSSTVKYPLARLTIEEKG
jgi:hypothetical protein